MYCPVALATPWIKNLATPTGHPCWEQNWLLWDFEKLDNWCLEHTSDTGLDVVGSPQSLARMCTVDALLQIGCQSCCKLKSSTNPVFDPVCQWHGFSGKFFHTNDMAKCLSLHLTQKYLHHQVPSIVGEQCHMSLVLLYMYTVTSAQISVLNI